MKNEDIRNFSIRLPIGTYEKMKKLVHEEKIALSVSDYCRQVITADVQKRTHD